MRRRWVRESRYYELMIQRDLFGTVVLTRVWGGIGSDLGGVAHEPCDGPWDARKRLRAAEKRRLAHKYRRVC